MVTSIRDAAIRLGIRYETLRAWCLVAGLPVGRLGYAHVVRLADVAALVEEKRAAQQKRAG